MISLGAEAGADADADADDENCWALAWSCQPKRLAVSRRLQSRRPSQSGIGKAEGASRTLRLRRAARSSSASEQHP